MTPFEILEFPVNLAHLGSFDWRIVRIFHFLARFNQDDIITYCRFGIFDKLSAISKYIQAPLPFAAPMSAILNLQLEAGIYAGTNNISYVSRTVQARDNLPYRVWIRYTKTN
jgi:hypothetical protein